MSVFIYDVDTIQIIYQNLKVALLITSFTKERLYLNITHHFSITESSLLLVLFAYLYKVIEAPVYNEYLN
jgi:hypothetical protein